MIGSRSIHRLALWGDVGCGKDTWAATLQLAAEKSYWRVRPFDQATAYWQATTWQRLSHGDFPHASDRTTSASALMPLTFELSCSTLFLGRQNILIQIPLASGAWWTGACQDQTPRVNPPDPISYLAYASGIICLLDPTTNNPTASASALMTMLDSLDRYRRQAKLSHPIRIALWLTKMDHPQHRREWLHEEAYARPLFGNRLWAFLLTTPGWGATNCGWAAVQQSAGSAIQGGFA